MGIPSPKDIKKMIFLSKTEKIGIFRDTHTFGPQGQNISKHCIFERFSIISGKYRENI